MINLKIVSNEQRYNSALRSSVYIVDLLTVEGENQRFHLWYASICGTRTSHLPVRSFHKCNERLQDRWGYKQQDVSLEHSCSFSVSCLLNNICISVSMNEQDIAGYSMKT